MKNNFIGLALIVYSLFVIGLTTFFAATFGDIYIALGFVIGIYIVIKTQHLFKYKSLEEKFEEELHDYKNYLKKDLPKNNEIVDGDYFDDETPGF